jgi:hypothetical protein
VALARGNLKKQAVAIESTNPKEDWLLKFLQRTMSKALREFLY